MSVSMSANQMGWYVAATLVKCALSFDYMTNIQTVSNTECMFFLSIRVILDQPTVNDLTMVVH